ncbi:hypothetical protein FQR65_LT12614 [Abscondita terminalis]|nr:hypothetical protein FQR65_LT12614 [Abscondita terminalis]
MKFLAISVFLTTILRVINGCVFEFGKNEKECAMALKYTAEKVLKYYNKGYPEEEENNFSLFVECVWHRWKFLDQKGNIKYNAIKNTHNKYFHVTGICDDVPLSTAERAKLFKEAVDQCEREARADYRAETARACIARHYKRRLPIIEEKEKEKEEE